METTTLTLPARLNISLKKRLLWVLSGIIFAPLSFLLLSSPSLSLNFAGLSSSETAAIMALIILVTTFVYPFLTSYLVLSEKGITEWSAGLIKIPWYYPWANIEIIKVVETNYPLADSSSIVPYKRKAVGIDFKQGLPVDPLSGKPDRTLKRVTWGMKFFTGSQMILGDVTNMFDKTIYGKSPEELVALLNGLRAQFAPSIEQPEPIQSTGVTVTPSTPSGSIVHTIWGWVLGLGIFLLFIPLPTALMICSLGNPDLSRCGSFLNPFGYAIPIGILLTIVGLIGWLITKPAKPKSSNL